MTEKGDKKDHEGYDPKTTSEENLFAPEREGEKKLDPLKDKKKCEIWGEPRIPL